VPLRCEYGEGIALSVSKVARSRTRAAD